MAAKYCSNPSGIWSTPDIIGSECRVAYIPVGYGFKHSSTGTYDSDDTHIISGVLHRVDTEGHMYTLYQLEDVPDRLFKASELLITKIISSPEASHGTLTGEFNSGQYGV